MAEEQLVFKLLLIGDSGVGKSSILIRFTDDKFEDEHLVTIGVDFKVKVMKVDGKKVKLTLWDTAGQERFRTLTSSYYRGAQGVILVYDVTSRESFDNLEVWFSELDTYATSKDIATMIIGNKIDEEDRRAVSREEGVALARRFNALFIECSAKTKAGIQQAFEELVMKILETPALVAGKKPTGTQREAASAADTVDLSATTHGQGEGDAGCRC